MPVMSISYVYELYFFPFFYSVEPSAKCYLKSILRNCK